MELLNSLSEAVNNGINVVFRNTFAHKKVLYMLNDFNESSYLMMFDIHSTQEEKEINTVFNFLNEDESLEFILFKELSPHYNLSLDFLLHRPLMTQDRKEIELLLEQIEERDKIQRQLVSLDSEINFKTKQHLNVSLDEKDSFYRQLPLPLNTVDHKIKDIRDNTLLKQYFVEPINQKILNITNKKDFNPYEPSNNFSLLQNKKVMVFFNNIVKKCFKFNEDDEMCLLISKYQKQFGFEEKLNINENEFNQSAFESLLKDKVFDTQEDFNELFTVFNKMNSETMILENKIKEYLLHHYRITESPVECISSKTLNDALVFHLNIPSKEVVSFRNKLGRILITFGLKKKRLSDGNYYYGLVPKNNKEETKPYSLDEFKNKLETLEKERKEMKYKNTDIQKLPPAISTSCHR